MHSFPCPTVKYDNCDLMHFHMTITTLHTLWHWHKFKRKTIILALVRFGIVRLPFLFEVPTKMDMKSLNLIPCIDIHIKISSIIYCTLAKIVNAIFPFLFKRFFSFLNLNSYPWHLRNPDILRGIASCGQRQNAIGVTIHCPIEIILLILWVSYISYLSTWI